MQISERCALVLLALGALAVAGGVGMLIGAIASTLAGVGTTVAVGGAEAMLAGYLLVDDGGES